MTAKQLLAVLGAIMTVWEFVAQATLWILGSIGGAVMVMIGIPWILLHIYTHTHRGQNGYTYIYNH